MIDERRHQERFAEIFGRPPAVLGSGPGRVNLIGEHTDYNGGFVMPAAIERNVLLAAAPAANGAGRLFSVQHEEVFDAANAPGKPGSWPSYYFAVLEMFRQRGSDPPALDVLIDGDVPLGAGLSSSAAYEVATAMMLNHLLEAGLNRTEIALLAQAAENSPLVGMRCGIMDQFASANGEEGKALRLDCHTLHFLPAQFAEPAPLILIINSMKRRGLVDSAYNERRQQCEEALEILRRETGASIETLRHVSAEQLAQHAGVLTPDQRKRVAHNLSENQRVAAFADAIAVGRWETAGELLYASHASLRDDYQVSCAELDAIVDAARETPGLYGCRMTGAGFGGCCVALVKEEALEPLRALLARNYTPRFNLEPTLLITRPAAGAWARDAAPAAALA